MTTTTDRELTTEEIEKIAATAEVLESLKVGSYTIEVQSNPFRGILDEEPRYYILVLTADGTTDDSHSANSLKAASKKAESLRKRLVREGFGG